MLLIREKKNSDIESVVQIARSLPQWFTPEGQKTLSEDFEKHQVLIAQSTSGVIGFLSFYYLKNAAHISWMGVHPDWHRRQIGKQLFEALRLHCQIQNIEAIFVSTLGESVEYEPYQRTRTFYQKMGFAPHKVILHPNNPHQEEELILKCPLKK